jgi:hypothetical protein
VRPRPSGSRECWTCRKMLYWEGQREQALDPCRQALCGMRARATDLSRIEEWFNARVDMKTTVDAVRILSELVKKGSLPKHEHLYLGVPGCGVLLHSHPPDEGFNRPNTLLGIHPDGSLTSWDLSDAQR